MDKIFITIAKKNDGFECYQNIWGKRGVTGINVDSMEKGIELAIGIEKSKSKFLYFVDISADEIEYAIIGNSG